MGNDGGFHQGQKWSDFWIQSNCRANRWGEDLKERKKLKMTPRFFGPSNGKDGDVIYCGKHVWKGISRAWETDFIAMILCIKCYWEAERRENWESCWIQQYRTRWWPWQSYYGEVKGWGVGGGKRLISVNSRGDREREVEGNKSSQLFWEVCLQAEKMDRIWRRQRGWERLSS